MNVPSARSRLRAALRPRVTRGQLVVGLLLAVLGFGLALQVRSNRSEEVLAGARQSDLVGILDDLTDRADRLEAEARELEVTRDRLASGSDRTRTALTEIRKRAETLGILAGTVPARGPGIELTVTDPGGTVRAAALLDAVQELRDAGAEAIQIGPVRVVASTSFVDGDPGVVVVDGQRLEPPYRFRVIGEPATLAAAMEIPGGVLEALRRDGADGTVVERVEVTVDALRPLAPRQYARPAPEGRAGSG